MAGWPSTAWRSRHQAGAGAGPAPARVATGLLYGDSERQREAALEVRDPVSLPWIAAALGRISDILAGLGP